jgi:signal transduction histidine kinase
MIRAKWQLRFFAGLQWWQVILGILAFWSLFAVLSIVQEALVYREHGVTVPWPRIVVLQFVQWWSWAPLTPLVYLLVRRFPMNRREWRSIVVTYVAVALVTLLLNAAIMSVASAALQAPIWPRLFGYWLNWQVAEIKPLTALYPEHLERLAVFDPMVFFLVVIAAHAALHYDVARDREREARRLNAQLASTRLDMVTMQLQPHFLFNTLNTISGFVRRDPARGDRMINGLASLLRTSLLPDRPQLVPVSEELTFVQDYLELQQARFESRLSARIHVGSGAERGLVPTFVIQPLLENTVRHAVIPYSAPVEAVVRIARLGDRLKIVVEDDGPGLPVEDPAWLPEGVGLRNTRYRLEQLYGDDHIFRIENRPAGGVRSILDLPWQTKAAG